jgi:peptide subunit release factor 1 (eRF1)
MEYNNQYASKSKFTCNKCGYATKERPSHKNATCVKCGKGRLKIQSLCGSCGEWFSPDRYTKKYCSNKCKVKAQSTGRKTFRVTDTKARSAQSLLSYHVKRKNIKKPTRCEECGKENQRIEGAHFNYDEPLKVRWLCRSCHVKWDKQNPKGVTHIIK